MLNDSLEMKFGILVHSAYQRCIRVHAYVYKQVYGQKHAIQILVNHYSTVHTTIGGNSLIHSNTEVLVGSPQISLLIVSNALVYLNLTTSNRYSSFRALEHPNLWGVEWNVICLSVVLL